MREKPETVKRYLTEFCVSLPHVLPMNLGLVSSDENSKLIYCPCNRKIKGWFKLSCRQQQSHIDITKKVLCEKKVLLNTHEFLVHLKDMSDKCLYHYAVYEYVHQILPASKRAVANCNVDLVDSDCASEIAQLPTKRLKRKHLR